MANDEETFMVDTEKARKTIVKKRSKCEMGKNAALARAFIQERFLRTSEHYIMRNSLGGLCGT